jgi:pilus assembly protein CpaF
MSESANNVTFNNHDLAGLKDHLVTLIHSEIDFNDLDIESRKRQINDLLSKHYNSLQIDLPGEVKEVLFLNVTNEILGFGILQPYLDDPEVTEVMVNGKDHIFIESHGVLSQVNQQFENDAQILRIIQKIIHPLGRKLDAEHPTIEARLPDGSRLNAVVSPVAIDGPLLTIRKYARNMLTMEGLIQMGAFSEEVALFLKACVPSRLNIIVTGETNAGKTSLLNALAGYIPENERIITIEEAAELNLRQPHIARLEVKLPDNEGKNAVTLRNLVNNALRMRPDRLILGEISGPECLDLLHAVNTGNDGLLATLHASSPRDAISRLEIMSLMDGHELPVKVVRSQIATAIDLVIHLSPLKGDLSCITCITEISGMESDQVLLTDIFKFEQNGVDPDGKVMGELMPTGIRPLFTPRLEAYGFFIPPETFGIDLSDILRDQKP